jgi:hypothetical protein
MTTVEDQLEQFIQRGMISQAKKTLMKTNPSPEQLSKFYSDSGFALLQWLDFQKAFKQFGKLRTASSLEPVLALFPVCAEEFNLTPSDRYGNINFIVTNAKSRHRKKIAPKNFAMTERENLQSASFYFASFLWAGRVRALEEKSPRISAEIVDTMLLRLLVELKNYTKRTFTIRQRRVEKKVNRRGAQDFGALHAIMNIGSHREEKDQIEHIAEENGTELCPLPSTAKELLLSENKCDPDKICCFFDFQQ